MHRIILSALVLFCLITFGCEKNTKPEEFKYGSVGGVISQAGFDLPLSLAYCHIQDANTNHWISMATDTTGAFILSNVTVGDQSLVIRRYGFRDTTLVISISRDDTLEAAISLQRKIPAYGHAYIGPRDSLNAMYVNSCFLYPNYLMIYSYNLDAPGSGWSTLMIRTDSYIVISTPLTVGTIDLAGNQSTYLRIKITSSDYLSSSVKDYYSSLPGGSGQIEILRVDPASHLVEAICRNVVMTTADGARLRISSLDLIGAWSE